MCASARPGLNSIISAIIGAAAGLVELDGNVDIWTKNLRLFQSVVCTDSYWIYRWKMNNGFLDLFRRTTWHWHLRYFSVWQTTWSFCINWITEILRICWRISDFECDYNSVHLCLITCEYLCHGCQITDAKGSSSLHNDFSFHRFSSHAPPPLIPHLRTRRKKRTNERTIGMTQIDCHFSHRSEQFRNDRTLFYRYVYISMINHFAQRSNSFNTHPNHREAFDDLFQPVLF